MDIGDTSNREKEKERKRERETERERELEIYFHAGGATEKKGDACPLVIRSISISQSFWSRPRDGSPSVPRISQSAKTTAMQ
jgi:hypothetical protein